MRQGSIRGTRTVGVRAVRWAEGAKGWCGLVHALWALCALPGSADVFTRESFRCGMHLTVKMVDFRGLRGRTFAFSPQGCGASPADALCLPTEAPRCASGRRAGGARWYVSLGRPGCRVGFSPVKTALTRCWDVWSRGPWS